MGLPTPTIVGMDTTRMNLIGIDLINVSIGAGAISFGQTEITLSSSENPNIT
jgi:hypothetical protein